MNTKRKLSILVGGLVFGCSLLSLNGIQNYNLNNANASTIKIDFQPTTQQKQKVIQNNSINQHPKSNIYNYSRMPKQTHHIYNQNSLKLPYAKSALAMNRNTGQIIYGKNIHHRYLTASTSKLMTLYLAERKLTQHPKQWNHKVNINQSLVRMSNNPSFDAFHFRPNKKYSIGTLFKSSLIGSADNSAIRLGQWVGGSNHHFIYMMNKQAKIWHLNASFDSACGLENNDLAPYGFWVRGNKYSGNTLSAKALATITYHLINDYPSIMKYSKMKSYLGMPNENNLLKGKKFYDGKINADGLKTGYTPRAGLCLVGTAKKGKKGVITVTLDDNIEFSDANKLMEFAYQHE